jgi:hypothetical protein
MSGDVICCSDRPYTRVICAYCGCEVAVKATCSQCGARLPAVRATATSASPRCEPPETVCPPEIRPDPATMGRHRK